MASNRHIDITYTSAMRFVAELRRRQMFRLTGLYIVGAWLVIQVADIVFPTWGIPDSAMRYVFLAALLCFPIAFVFGWMFDVTKDGIVRTRQAGPDEIIGAKMERADYAILVALLTVGLAILLGSTEKIQEQVDELPAAIERRENGIAVLPFDNLDDNPETGYFSDGVTEEILSQLSSLGPLHVIGRTSSFAYRTSGEGPAEISEALGVSYMLLGSVRRDGNLVRVTARLVDRIGTQLWTESYDRELKNIFAIQSEIARSVAGRIVNKIVPRDAPSDARTTTSVEAYDAYLIARALFNARTPGWTHEVEEDLTKALELDPNFAPAHAMLAISYDYRFDLNVEERRERVCGSAQRAIDLAPNLAEANLAIGQCHARNDDQQRLLESARRAVALDPSFSMAYNLLSYALVKLGRDDEARAVRQQGLDIDPMNPTLILNSAFEHHNWGDQKRAEQLFLRAASAPEPARTISWHLSIFYAETGRFDKSIQWAQEDIRGYKNNMEQFSGEAIDYRVGLFAYDHLRLGLPDEAEALRQLINSIHFDEFGDLMFRSQQTLLQGQLTEFRSLAGPLAEIQQSYGRDLTEDEKAELGIFQIIAGRTDRGIELLQPLIVVEPFDAEESTIRFSMMRRMLYYAYALQQAGPSTEATDLLQRVLAETESIDQRNEYEIPVTFKTMALSHGLLGNQDRAVVALERAIELGWADYYRVINDPLWIKAFEGIDLQRHLSDVKARLDRQRAAFEQANAGQDFVTELKQIFRKAGKLDEEP